MLFSNITLKALCIWVLIRCGLRTSNHTGHSTLPLELVTKGCLEYCSKEQFPCERMGSDFTIPVVVVISFEELPKIGCVLGQNLLSINHTQTNTVCGNAFCTAGSKEKCT